MNIAELKPVPLRQLWLHEANDFTVWLADNLDAIGDKLNINLTLIDREVSTGAFSADILAEDGDGNSVIIENQLERTDHDHLGKLITYMSNLDAKTAIWITSEPRPEHETAVHWLNEALPADTSLYLVKLEAYQIGESPAAPLFSIVAGPTPEARQIGTQKKVMAQRNLLLLEFWEQLLERANARTQLHARISPSKDHWISAGGGKSGLAFSYVILRNEGRIELYIDTTDANKNELIFSELVSKREEIERAYGESLEWDPLPGRHASRIHHTLKNGGLADTERWPAIQSAMVDAMARLEHALKSRLRSLPY